MLLAWKGVPIFLRPDPLDLMLRVLNMRHVVDKVAGILAGLCYLIIKALNINDHGPSISYQGIPSHRSDRRVKKVHERFWDREAAQLFVQPFVWTNCKGICGRHGPKGQHGNPADL